MFDLKSCVPNVHSMMDIVPKYKHVIEINANEMLLTDLDPIEEWCDENFGKLIEESKNSPWQLTFDEHIKDGTFNRFLYFHFHDVLFATAFKLRWA